MTSQPLEAIMTHKNAKSDNSKGTFALSTFPKESTECIIFFVFYIKYWEKAILLKILWKTVVLGQPSPPNFEAFKGKIGTFRPHLRSINFLWRFQNYHYFLFCLHKKWRNLKFIKCNLEFLKSETWYIIELFLPN